MKNRYLSLCAVLLVLSMYSCNENLDSQCKLQTYIKTLGKILSGENYKKLNVKGVKASSEGAGQSLLFSIDGEMSTFYHSVWDNSTPSYFPITLQYNFDKEKIDHIIYHPRQDGSVNGNFEKIKLYAKTIDINKPFLVKEIEMQSQQKPVKIEFDEPLIDVTSIIFEVLEGAGHGCGFAACAEMEFYRKERLEDWVKRKGEAR